MFGRVLAIAALALIIRPEALGAQSDSSAARAPLGPDETALRVSAKGSATLPADAATMHLDLRSTAQTEQEARRAVAALADELRRDLIARGVPAASIVVEEGTRNTLGFIGNAALEEPPEVAVAMARLPKSASMTITLELSDMTLLPRVRQLLHDRDFVAAQPPAFRLRNERPARDAAIAGALARARADAEAYARPLGLRVGRLVEVRDLAASSSASGGFEGEMMTALVRGIRGDDSATVVTEVHLAVDFILLRR
ncbi:MAG TPA: SIMPL domain-containing protein [Allosphingosinicella sp.]|jgi:hypothetical protein